MDKNDSNPKPETCQYELQQPPACTAMSANLDHGEQNTLLIQQIEELKEKLTQSEMKTKQLQEEKKKSHREHKNQLAKQKKKVKTLTENLRSKEELVIPVRRIMQDFSHLRYQFMHGYSI